MIQIGDFPSNSPMGWICPKCGRVYSPSTPMCTFCGPTTTQTTWAKTNINDDLDQIKDYLNYYVAKETTCKTEI